MSGFEITTCPRSRITRAFPRGRVAVVDRGRQVGGRRGHDLLELGGLVLGQRLGREEVEGATARASEEGVEDRQVVAERLPARGRRDHDRVASGTHVVEGLPLVDVEPLDAAARQGGDQALVEIGRQVGVDRLGRLLDAVDHDPLGEGSVVAEAVEHRADVRPGQTARPGCGHGGTSREEGGLRG